MKPVLTTQSVWISRTEHFSYTYIVDKGHSLHNCHYLIGRNQIHFIADLENYFFFMTFSIIVRFLQNEVSIFYYYFYSHNNNSFSHNFHLFPKEYDPQRGLILCIQFWCDWLTIRGMFGLGESKCYSCSVKQFVFAFSSFIWFICFLYVTWDRTWCV